MIAPLSLAFALFVFALSAGATIASAQTPAANAADPARNDPQQTTDEQTESNDRLFWALPNFLTVENGDRVPPLTTGQKFNIWRRSAFDEVEFGWYGVLAGLSQAEDSEPWYGTGGTGFVKRYGSEFADGTLENLMVGAVFPSLFHDDPRYYQLGHGGAWHRVGYSVSRIVVTRTDGGRRQFNVSEVFGSAAAAVLSNAYHPSGDRGIANTMNTWWSQVGYDTATILIKEFWPDIRRRFSKR